MPQGQLTRRFQMLSEVAVGLITLDQALMMIEQGWLTYEGACYLLPASAWVYLPQPD